MTETSSETAETDAEASERASVGSVPDEASVGETETGPMADGNNSDEDEPVSDPKPGDELSAALAGSALLSKGTVAEPQESFETEEEIEVEHADESSGTLAGKVLTGLVLLIAGIGIGLWGAPKLAPHIPNGLAPVRTWLLPGEGAVRAELEAVRAEMDARFAALPKPVDAETISAELRGAVSAQAEDFEAQIASLSDQIAGADSEAIEARLNQLETRLAGISGQIESFGDLAAVEGLSEDSLAEISQFSSAIAGMRAEISEMAAKNGALSQRLEEVAASANRRVEEAEIAVAEAEVSAEDAERTAAVRSSIATIRASLAAGSPYQEAVDIVVADGNADVPQILTENAESGFATMTELRASFGDAALDAIRAEIKAEAGGPVSRFGAFLQSQVAARSLTPKEGNSTDAIVSRMSAALDDGNLERALTEAEDLSEAASAAMAGWLQKAHDRANAAAAIEDLSVATLGTN
ncbi:COG4223 family protein [Algicella marina]|uniref:Mitochondrial inner membrane protein n=1 Tax=Algicella marina TaxID=2683284 RepID=A0A6P1T5A2_9RHOB|nr:hypothetical protein [Algicella marina]QHQ36900.1 hypothetical protein GO499_17775 [Algicella marina]